MRALKNAGVAATELPLSRLWKFGLIYYEEWVQLFLCRCQRASLPVDERMTVQILLATLEVMNSQVLTVLIRNSAVQDVSSMLEARSTRVQVTMAMRLKAAADEKHGAELMSLLLARPRESFYEAEAIATTAIRNSKQGAKILEALLLS